MRKFYGLAVAAIFGQNVATAQQTCIINLNANPLNVCVGDSTQFVANGFISGTSNYNFDFNSAGLPSGWSVGGGTSWSSPCIPSLDGSPYYWASTAVGTPYIETPDLDVSSGGTIDFEFIFAVQGGPTPCEGPDEQDEGVSLQYSTNAGVSWFDITYFSPGGFQLPSNPGGNTSIASGPTAYTVWNTVSIPIPPAAVTTSTRFRFIQLNSSGSCCDNWGVDNVVVSAGTALQYAWSNGVVGFGTNAGTQTLYNLQQDTCLVVTVLDTVSGISCSDTICVTVFPLPIPQLTYNNPICAGDLITFDGTQSTPTSGISTYEFDLDNNGVYEYSYPSGLQSFSYFTISGSYTINYQVSTPGGCTATSSYPVQVFSNPTLNLLANPTTICLGTPITLLAQGNVINPPSLPSSIDYFDWDFDNNGTVDSTDNPSGDNSSITYVFNTPGSYTIHATTTTTGGCSASDSVVVTVNDQPIGGFSSMDVCFGQNTELIDTTMIQAPDFISSYDWTITNTTGYNYTGSLPTVNQAFPEPGQYTATLIVVTGQGCTDTIQTQFEVFAQPQADFIYSTECFQKVIFQDQSTGGTGSLGLQWDLTNDGNPDEVLSSFEYIFPDSNDALVTLTVIDSNNCVSDTTMLVNVKGGVENPEMPNVMSLSSMVGNNKYDFQAFAPGFNECINYTLVIYNRWGTLVYQAENDINNPDLNCDQCFTGKTENGATLSPGTYYYVLKGNNEEGTNEVELNGVITIFQ